jgi:hypothetical protein
MYRSDNIDAIGCLKIIMLHVYLFLGNECVATVKQPSVSIGLAFRDVSKVIKKSVLMEGGASSCMVYAFSL